MSFYPICWFDLKCHTFSYSSSKHTMKSIWFHFLSHTYLQKRKSLKLHSWRNFNAFKLRWYYVSNIGGFIKYTIIGGIEAIDDTLKHFCAITFHIICVRCLLTCMNGKCFYNDLSMNFHTVCSMILENSQSLSIKHPLKRFR